MIHDEFSATTGYSATRYKRRQEARGRCQNCPNPPKPGRKRCASCMARAVARNRQRLQRKRNEQLAKYGGI
jgi:hypothetical protein